MLISTFFGRFFFVQPEVTDRFGGLLWPGFLWDFFQEKRGGCTHENFFHLTWPISKLLKLFGITYLVGKISRSNCYFSWANFSDLSRGNEVRCAI